MVGRHNSFSVTKRSLRNAETISGKRPRRNVQSKLVDDTVGLSRQEEQELNKALYASLQENRRSKSLPGNVGNESSNSSTSNGGPSGSSSKSSVTSSIKSNLDSHSRPLMRTLKTNKRSLGHRHSLRTGAISNKYHLRQSALLAASRVQKSKSTSSLPSVTQSRTSSASTSNVNLDESSQDSSTSSANGSKRKIHAQRKFAQGCSLPGTPTCTPVKSATPPTKMMSFRIPKTEDFLTFLCLRGTSALPPHLNFFNYSREELASRDEGQTSASATVSKAVAKSQRESTPESSSTSSEANNEEVAEAASVSTPSPTIRGGNSLLAKRSAARASAGTPETARGIVSLRQGLQRKVSTSSSSSSLARFPVSSPSRLLATSSLTKCAVTTTTPPGCRNKFYFTPEKSLSPPKASGVRPGEFTPPSLFSSARLETPYLSRPHTFSPLVCSSSSSKLTSLHSRSDSPSSHGSSTSTLSSSASRRRSPDALLRKGGTPDLSSRDNMLNVKVTPICNIASLSSLHVGHCRRLDLQDCLPPSTLSSKSSSLPGSVTSSCSSTRSVTALSSRSPRVTQTHIHLSVPPKGPSKYNKKYVYPNRQNVTKKRDLFPPKRYTPLKGVHSYHTSQPSKLGSASQTPLINSDMLTSRCCHKSCHTNTNPCNTNCNVRPLCNHCHCLNQSACSLHDCSYPASCTVSHCACSHSKSSNLLECCTSVKTMCVSQVAHETGICMKPPHCHSVNCCTGCPAHCSLQESKCTKSSGAPIAHGLPVNQSQSHSTAHGLGVGFSSCSQKLNVLTLQDKSSSFCHHSDVISNCCSGDTTDTYGNIAQHGKSLPDNSSDNKCQDSSQLDPHCQIFDHRSDLDIYTKKVTCGLNLTSQVTCNSSNTQCSNRNQGNKVWHDCHDGAKRSSHSESNSHRPVPISPRTLDKRHIKCNILRRQTEPTVKKGQRSKQSFELKDKCSTLRHGGLSKYSNDDPQRCPEQRDLSRSSLQNSPRPHLVRAGKLKNNNDKNKNSKLVRNRLNLSALSKSKLSRIINNGTRTQKKYDAFDFQKEFVKMLDADGLNRSSTQQWQGSADKIGCNVATNSNWSVNDNQLSDVTQCSDGRNDCFGQSRESSSRTEPPQTVCTEEQQAFLKHALLVPPKPDNQSIVSKQPGDLLKHTKFRSEMPSTEILMLREEVISAFSKFNRKDVIASSIQAAKAVEMSEVDVLAKEDQAAKGLELSDVNTSAFNLSKDIFYTEANQLSDELDCKKSSGQSSQRLDQCINDSWPESIPVECQTTDDILSIFNQSIEKVTKTNFVDNKGCNISVQADSLKSNLQKSESLEESNRDIMLSEPKPVISSSDLSLFQVKTLCNKPGSSRVITYPSEAALAVIGWSLNQPLINKRNKQIQTNLCEAVGHCSLSDDLANTKTSSIVSEKPVATSASPAGHFDHCICQKELEKHCAKLQECLCTVCKLKFCGHHPLNKDTIYRNNTTEIKVGKAEVNSSFSSCYESTKREVSEIEETGFSLVKGSESLTSVSQGFNRNKCNWISQKHNLQSAQSTDHLATSSKKGDQKKGSKIDSEVPLTKKRNASKCPEASAGQAKLTTSGQNRTDTCHSQVQERRSNLQSSSLTRSISLECSLDDFNKDETSDYAIDLSLKKTISSVINSTDHVQSDQNTNGSQSKSQSTSSSKNLVPFDLTEIFEWSIPSSSNKPKLNQQNVKELHFSHRAEISPDSSCKPPLKGNESATKEGTTIQLIQNKTFSKKNLNVMNSTDSQKLIQNESDLQDWSRDLKGGSLITQYPPPHLGSNNTNISLNNNQSTHVRSDSPCTSDFSTTYRNTEGDKLIKNRVMNSKKILNVSRTNHLTNESTLGPRDQHRFTNEDLNRLIESVTNTGQLKNCKRKTLRKESSTKGSRHLVKSKSLDEAGMYLGSTHSSLWPGLQAELPIMLHSYGSLNTGQGFTFVNGQLQQCQILNRQNLFSDVYRSNVITSTSSSQGLNRWTTGSTESNVLPRLLDAPPLNSSVISMECPSRRYNDEMFNRYLVSTSTAVNSAPVHSDGSSKTISHNSSTNSGQRIHCLGRSIYLHHDQNVRVLKCSQTDEQQLVSRDDITHHQTSSSIQPYVLNLSTHRYRSDVSAATSTATNECSGGLDLFYSKSVTPVESFEPTTVTEDQHAGMENSDDVVIIEDEVKYSNSLAETVPSVPQIHIDGHSPQLEVPFDEPIDLHISVSDRECGLPVNILNTSKESVSSNAYKLLKHSESQIVPQDGSSLSITLQQQKHLAENTQEFCDLGQGNLLSKQSANSVLENNAPSDTNHNSNRESEVLDFSMQDQTDSNVLGGLKMGTISCKENSNVESFMKTDLSVMNFGTLPPDLLSHIDDSIPNFQNTSSNDNILEALMKELQMQITILNEELHQGNDQSVNFTGQRPEAIYHRHDPGTSRHDGADDIWKDLAAPVQLPLDVSDSVHQDLQNLITSPGFQSILKSNLVEFIDISSDTDD